MTKEEIQECVERGHEVGVGEDDTEDCVRGKKEKR